MSLDFLKLSLLMDDDFGLLLAQEYKQNTKTTTKPKFHFDLYSDARCKHDFRFLKSDIYRLYSAMSIPKWMKTKNGLVFKGIEGLCILLNRLAYPSRLVQLQLIFGRSIQALSAIFNEVLDFIFNKYRRRLTSWDQWWLQPDYLESYSEAIKRKGSPLDGCIGFIDGTFHYTCRPRKHQKQVYSGHKRAHGLKYQAVVLPNGLIANLYGPEVGRRHDSFMLKCSGIINELRNHVGADKYCLYGDGGYGLNRYLINPFLGSNVTVEQQQFNAAMSSLRISVEWEFGDLFRQSAFLGYKNNQKIFLQPLSKYVIVATLLKNCMACLYGNQTSKYFNCPAPEIENYLNNFI